MTLAVFQLIAGPYLLVVAAAYVAAWLFKGYMRLIGEDITMSRAIVFITVAAPPTVLIGYILVLAALNGFGF